MTNEFHPFADLATHGCGDVPKPAIDGMTTSSHAVTTPALHVSAGDA